MLVEFICAKCLQAKPCMMKDGKTVCVKCAKEEIENDPYAGDLINELKRSPHGSEVKKFNRPSKNY